MPVEDIIDYFNDRLRKRKVRFIPEEPFVFQGNRVEGRFGAFALSSEFRPVICNTPRGLVSIGEEAETTVRRLDARPGLPGRIDALYSSIAEPASIVYLDRLRRTVHMLNYLVRNADDEQGLLFMEVQQRHIMSVASNHGKYFEAVLARCGLTPSRIVLTLRQPVSGQADIFRLAQGINNYRARGYQIAVGLSDLFEPQGCLERLWRLPPEIVKLDPVLLHTAVSGERWMRLQYRSLVRTSLALGANVYQAGIGNAEQLHLVHDAGAQFLSGKVFEGSCADVPNLLVGGDSRLSQANPSGGIEIAYK